MKAELETLAVREAMIEAICRVICEVKGYDPDMPTGENRKQWESFKALAASTSAPSPHPRKEQDNERTEN